MAVQSVATLVESHYVQQNHELYQDRRNIAEKSADLIKSIWGELGHFIGIFSVKLFDVHNSRYDHCDKKKEWKKESAGCVVFLSGLNGYPAIWKSQLAKLENEPTLDRFIPYIPEKGDCALEKAAMPIYQVVKDYTKTHPGKKICLLGVSNGGRLATYIETKLRSEAPTTPILISTIAGAHFGSRWATLIQDIGLKCTPFHTSEVLEELTFGSTKAKELLDAVQKPLEPNVKRSYQFFASTEDLTIVDLASAIPKTGSIERTYTVLHGESHNTIVSAVADQQMSHCLAWLRA